MAAPFDQYCMADPEEPRGVAQKDSGDLAAYI
jgi:hypothetical protein